MAAAAPPISRVSTAEVHHCPSDQRDFMAPMVAKVSAVAATEATKGCDTASVKGTRGTRPRARQAAKVAAVSRPGARNGRARPVDQQVDPRLAAGRYRRCRRLQCRTRQSTCAKYGRQPRTIPRRVARDEIAAARTASDGILHIGLRARMNAGRHGEAVRHHVRRPQREDHLDGPPCPCDATNNGEGRHGAVDHAQDRLAQMRDGGVVRNLRGWLVHDRGIAAPREDRP